MRKNNTEMNNTAAQSDFQKIANRVSVITIIRNIALVVLKLIAGIMAHSNAMISDAIHSASDVFSTFVVIIGIKLASKKPDKEHPYGHERLECVAAVILAIVLFITGLGIGLEALKNILQGNYSNLQVPGILALVAAIISIVIKECMYWYTRHYSKKRFQCFDGGCMASSFRCPFFGRSFNRNRRSETEFPNHGFHCKSCNFPVYC